MCFVLNTKHIVCYNKKQLTLNESVALYFIKKSIPNYQTARNRLRPCQPDRDPSGTIDGISKQGSRGQNRY